MANAFGQSASPGGAGDKEREAASWRASTSATVGRLMEIVRQHDAQLRSLRNDHDALREEANSLRRSLDVFSTAPPGKKPSAALSVRGRANSGGPTGMRNSSSGDLAPRGGRQAQLQDIDSASPSSSTMPARDARRQSGTGIPRLATPSDSNAQLAIRRRNSDSSFDKAHKGSAGVTDLWSVTKPLLEPGSSKEQQILALNCFKQALKAGAAPHNWSGPNTPLRTAVEAGRLDMVTELLKARASSEESDSKGVSLLHLAAFSDKKEVCRALLNAKAQTNSVDQHGQTPLFFAPSRAVCDVLLSRRADTNIVNNKGQSALHFAGQAGMSEVLVWLSQHVSPAVLDLRDDYNATGSYYAKAAGVKPEIYHRLQSGSQVAERGAAGSERRLPTVPEEDSEVATPTSPSKEVALPESHASSGEESASERAAEEAVPASRVPWQSLSAARDSKASAAAPSAQGSSKRLAAERAARPKAAWGSNSQNQGSPQAMRVAAARASAQTPTRTRGGRPASPPSSPSHSQRSLDLDEEAFNEMLHDDELTRERRPSGVTQRPMNSARQAQEAASRNEVKARAMRMKTARDSPAARAEGSAAASASPLRPADAEVRSSPSKSTNSLHSPQSDEFNLHDGEDAHENRASKELSRASEVTTELLPEDRYDIGAEIFARGAATEPCTENQYGMARGTSAEPLTENQDHYDIAAMMIQAAFRRRNRAISDSRRKKPLQGSKLGELRERQESEKSGDASSKSASSAQGPRSCAAEETVAATQLQAALRGRLARKSLRSLKQKIVEDSERSTDDGEELLTADSPTTIAYD